MLPDSQLFRGSWRVLLCICVLTFGATESRGQTNDGDMLAFLLKMVEEDPQRSDSWRLIGRIYKQRNRLDDARAAFQKSLAVQPDNIATHADLGDLLKRIGEKDAAQTHYDQVMLLGPESSYAAELVERGVVSSIDPDASSVINADYVDDGESESTNLIGYEIQTFDGADDLDQMLNNLDSDALTPQNRIRSVVEIGTLYNSNLSLTPISRSLRTGDGSSAQLFISPSVEWIAIDNGIWRAGPLGRGHFTFNEGNFESLNLASFQPGIFVERDLEWGNRPVIGRLDYTYGIDLLGGSRFADRHSLTASLTTILPDNDVIYSYFATSFSNFDNDGANPSVESLDGMSYTAGVSRFFTTDLTLLPTWSLGADLEHADTRGADFRYTAINLHADTTFQLSDTVSLVPRAGIGYRHYPDFTGAVDRDELTWRVGARLRWQLTENMSVSAVAGYDRFASDNDLFDTDRTEAGVVFTFLH